MATVDKAFADNLIAHQGYYNGDSNNDLGDNPRCTKVVEYRNAFGGVGYGLSFETDRDQFKYEAESEFVQSPKVIWRHGA